MFFFYKQKTTYEISTCMEFRRVLFRSAPRVDRGHARHVGEQRGPRRLLRLRRRRVLTLRRGRVENQEVGQVIPEIHASGAECLKRPPAFRS